MTDNDDDGDNDDDDDNDKPIPSRLRIAAQPQKEILKIGQNFAEVVAMFEIFLICYMKK